jgi:FkbM family methyltransferase
VSVRYAMEWAWCVSAREGLTPFYGENAMKVPENRDLIFDVGAHRGEDSDFYLKLGYRVIAVEANPVLAEQLRARFTNDIRNGRYFLIAKAVGGSAEPVTFYINKKNSVWGTADPEWAKRNLDGFGAESEEIQVQGIQFSEAVREYGCPFYLKIDVEGADMLCVTALKEMDCCPKYLSIESTKTSWSELLNEFDVLEELGFTKFAVVDQRDHKSGKFTGRDGQKISYSFPNGATGPFGEDLDGVWLRKEEAIKRYARIFMGYRMIGDFSLLVRILRRIPKLGHRLVGRISTHVGWYDTHAMRE